MSIMMDKYFYKQIDIEIRIQSDDESSSQEDKE